MSEFINDKLSERPVYIARKAVLDLPEATRGIMRHYLSFRISKYIAEREIARKNNDKTLIQYYSARLDELHYLSCFLE